MKHRYTVSTLFKELKIAIGSYLNDPMNRAEYHNLTGNVAAFTGHYAAIAFYEDDDWEEFLRDIAEYRDNFLKEKFAKSVK
jgi:hypothetical protein